MIRVVKRVVPVVEMTILYRHCGLILRGGDRPANALQFRFRLSVVPSPGPFCCSTTMPRNRKKKIQASQTTAPQTTAPQTTAPQTTAPTIFPSWRPISVPSVVPTDRSNSSVMSVYPSVYLGGSVEHNPYGSTVTATETFTSIVCQAEYSHLSPEVLHIRTTESIFRVLRATLNRRCASWI